MGQNFSTPASLILPLSSFLWSDFIAWSWQPWSHFPNWCRSMAGWCGWSCPLYVCLNLSFCYAEAGRGGEGGKAFRGWKMLASGGRKCPILQGRGDGWGALFLYQSAPADIPASLSNPSLSCLWVAGFLLTLLFQTIFLNYLLPALPLHSYYCLPMPCRSQVLGSLLPRVSFCPALLSSCHEHFHPQPSLCFRHTEILSSTAVSVYNHEQSMSSFSAEDALPWCLYILTVLLLMVLLFSVCFSPHYSYKCGPSCNDAAHRKTPFSCDRRQPLELIPGKMFLSFLSYAFLQTHGQSDDWGGEEWSDDWGRVVQWLGSHLKFRKIVSPMLFLCAVLLFALQFTQQSRHISFSVTPFSNSKIAPLLCSW